MSRGNTSKRSQAQLTSTLSWAPDALTLSTGPLSTIALILAAEGRTELACRLVMICLAVDVLDGYLARRLGTASERGELLDRLFDRLYQVVVPSMIYYMFFREALAAVYAASIVTISYWRIVRRVPSREYFAGLPLNVHTVLMVASIYSGFAVDPAALLVLALLSALPLKYYRRRASGASRDGSLWPIRFAVPLAIALFPRPLETLGPLFLLLEIAALAYAAFGWLPLALSGRGPLRSRVLHRAS